MQESRACLTEEVILDFISGALKEDQFAAVERHARTCPACQERISVGFAAAAATSSEPGPLARGTAIGRYTVRTMVGQGGMGEVYAAYDPHLDRMIALKVLRSQAGDDTPAQGQRRLMREAQAIARLSHANVITVHDVGTHDGRVFLAMEYVEGQTLSGWLTPARTEAEIVGIFREAARGLAAAHAAGVVHRDFKPQNVMVAGDGTVRVTDFGLARRLDAVEAGPPGLVTRGGLAPTSDMSLTKTGELVGTPRYMAPEQLAGRPIDARSDQFSFCVALYEAIYGEHPFLAPGPRPAPGERNRGELDELVVALRAGVVRPRPANRRVSGWLRRVVMRGLSAAPGDRWPSMDHLIAALAGDRARQRRRPLLLASAALAALAVSIGFASRGRDGGARAKPFQEPRVSVVREAPPPPAPVSPPAPVTAPAAVTAPLRATLPDAPAPRASARAQRRVRVGAPAAAPGPIAEGERLLRVAEEELGQAHIAEACAKGHLAAKAAPQSPAIWEFLGRCHMRLGEPEAALTCYRRYLALAPDGPQVPFVRAIVERDGP
jgi:serine/threonine protein kinase